MQIFFFSPPEIGIELSGVGLVANISLVNAALVTNTKRMLRETLVMPHHLEFYQVLQKKCLSFALSSLGLKASLRKWNCGGTYFLRQTRLPHAMLPAAGPAQCRRP